MKFSTTKITSRGSVASPVNGQLRAASRASSQKRSTHRTAASRQLLEEYWRSVWAAPHQPPLYHTFSDRYGGTKGVPYASRGGGAAGRGKSAVAAGGEAAMLNDVRAALESADEAFYSGQIDLSRERLEGALTLLQNAGEEKGALTVADLTQMRSLDAPEGGEHSSLLAEVLRCLGMLQLICGRANEALELFNLSISADPLHIDTYLLRASCCEALREYAMAVQDYEKYMKLTVPSMEVLAHCGKCAAEAGLHDTARALLEQLLSMAEMQLDTSAGAGSREGLANLIYPCSTPIKALALAEEGTTHPLQVACAFYAAHAHFYLGYVDEKVSTSEGLTKAEASLLRKQAAQHYHLTSTNSDYVQQYEASVEQAIAATDTVVAMQLLKCLRKIDPDCAVYYVQMAHVCHQSGDVDGELRALSAALDRRQMIEARCSTLLARGMVYAEKKKDFSCAISDYALLLSEVRRIGVAEEPSVAWCTPVAYLRRAEVYCQRQRREDRSTLQRKEDEEAALRDYSSFLDALAAMPGSSSDLRGSNDFCEPRHVRNALLVLASGSYRRQQYKAATLYIARAIASGWRPQTSATATAAVAAMGTSSSVSLSEDVPEQPIVELYISLAHHVMEVYPIGEDMFKVPYEQRDAQNVSSPAESRRGNRAGDRGRGVENERHGFLSFPLMYCMVDDYFLKLRALEPTMFSSVEGAFLELWEPYRLEVERVKDDVTSVRAARRPKR